MDKILDGNIAHRRLNFSFEKWGDIPIDISQEADHFEVRTNNIRKPLRCFSEKEAKTIADSVKGDFHDLELVKIESGKVVKIF